MLYPVSVALRSDRASGGVRLGSSAALAELRGAVVAYCVCRRVACEVAGGSGAEPANRPGVLTLNRGLEGGPGPFGRRWGCLQTASAFMR